jgi:hypothetical protein
LFDLLDRPLHWIPVKWPALIAPKKEDDLSLPGEHEVELRVELLDREEAIWRFPAMFGEDRKPRGTPPEGCADPNDPQKWGPTPETLDSFKRIVHDWRKISAKGRRVEINDENISRLFASPMFEMGFMTAYLIALGGQAETREKNLQPSPDDGRGDTENEPTTSSSGTATVSE